METAGVLMFGHFLCSLRPGRKPFEMSHQEREADHQRKKSAMLKSQLGGFNTGARNRSLSRGAAGPKAVRRDHLASSGADATKPAADAAPPAKAVRRDHLNSSGTVPTAEAPAAARRLSSQGGLVPPCHLWRRTALNDPPTPCFTSCSCPCSCTCTHTRTHRRWNLRRRD